MVEQRFSTTDVNFCHTSRPNEVMYTARRRVRRSRGEWKSDEEEERGATHGEVAKGSLNGHESSSGRSRLGGPSYFIGQPAARFSCSYSRIFFTHFLPPAIYDSAQ